MLIVVVLFLSWILTACADAPIGFDTYFKNFKSSMAYSGIEELLRLSDYEELKDLGVYFSSYHSASDIYILTKKTVISDALTITQHGFASVGDGLLIAPRYSDVLDIKGDYAIVTREVAVGNMSNIQKYIGLVKIRGENKGKEFGFSYIYMPLITQYSFLDYQYLVMLGHKAMTNTGTTTSISYTTATIYDYTTAKGNAILSVGFLSEVKNQSTFEMFEGNIVSIYYNEARFYQIKDIGSNGYFNKKGEFFSFDTNDGYAIENIGTEIFYIGNNWFLISGTYTTTTDTGLHDFSETDEDGSTKYLTIKSASFNTTHYKSFEIKNRIVMVANKYSDDELRGIIDIANTNNDVDELDGKGKYYPPIVPMSSAIKDKYSIVYYYYYEYILGMINWSVTYSLYDQNAKSIELETLMPMLYVDGKGLYNADPNFNLVPMDADYYTYAGKRIVIDSKSDFIGYSPFIMHDGMIISYKLELNGLTADTFVGAYDLTGKLAVPYKYLEFTPYFGGYATASRVDENLAKRRFFRINKNGAEIEIDDAFALRNGVYITYIIEDERVSFGLNANDGSVLIPKKADVVSIIDSFLNKDGSYVSSVVITVENGSGVIYRLK